MRIALYQPDIPQNTGTILRMAACMAIGVDIIEPCGFALDDKRLRRAGMDYLDQVDLNRHISWDAFQKNCTETNNRLVLLTTSGDLPYCDFIFQTDDRLLLGRESAGAPAEVHNAAAARIRIPITEGTRSLNIAVAASMVLGEALRQTKGFSEGANP
jgi:tRNA (cytidine/uridine-2'-O-)-methyltransferase